MPGKAVGRAAVELPWLCPNTDSLVALADAPATVPALSVADPALCVFLLRFARFAAEPDTFGFAPGALLSPTLPDTAASYLASTTAGVVPAGSHVLARVRTVAERAAVLAARIADATRLAPAEVAATVARLVPLGWYATAAIDPFGSADPLNDSAFAERPGEVQAALWGLDHAAITRRLAARWRLPSWAATTIGCMTLPFRVAGHLVSHRELFAVVQLATVEAESQATSLGLTHGAHRDELLDFLRFDERLLRDFPTRYSEAPAEVIASGMNPDPHRVPLVRNLLRQAAENRRRNGPSLVARLEDQIDRLHATAAELGDQVGDRLQQAKLAGLAELAAGAGHEINNPLASISGNAQRLLRTEPDTERGDSLRAIVRQAHRIAGILRDLMQFARPPRPEAGVSPFADLVQAVRDELAPLVAERGVRLDIDGVPAGVWVEGDAKQLRHALTAVVRNAVEAVETGGWVRVACAAPTEAAEVTIEVEDGGPGLTAEAAEHAFDPFYCGRSAGRGRGLGLSTAWQFVRQNGGELRYAPAPDGPTRFVVSLKRAIGHERLTLRSA